MREHILVIGASWDPFGLVWAHLGLLAAILSNLRDILGPKASKLAPAARDRVPGSPSWVLLGSIRGSILGSDRPKRGQDGPKRTIKRCKIPKTCICKKVFGGPRPSKTGSEDPRRLPRSYLGLLRAILSHLWGMLGPGASKIAPAALDCVPGPRYWILLGSN